MSRRWPSSYVVTQPVCARLAPSSSSVRRREAALRDAARSAVELLEDRRLFAVELLPPVIAGMNAPDVTGSPTSYVVTVNYLDDGGLNLDSINASDLSVTAPGGGNLQVTGVDTTGDANALQAKYTVSAPGGLAPGEYTVAVRDNEVLDQSGKAAPGASTTFDVEADTDRPIGTITVDDVTANGATHTVRIVYTDNVGINRASIGADDIAVNGPGGLLTVTDVDVTGSGTDLTAVYTIAAPNGSWASVGGSEYTVLLSAGAVTDTSGNTVPARTRSFEVDIDSVGPSVSVGAQDITARIEPDAYRVTVTYDDPAGINAAFAGADDITVTGPAGPLAVEDVSATPSDDGRTLTVRYTLTPPGATWDEADNGDYTVTVAAGAVTDTAGNPSEAGSKTFQVQVPPPDVTAPLSTIANADLSSNKSNHQVKITFTDDRGLAEATFGEDDITVSGPGGSVDVTDVSADRQDGGRRYVVTYTLAGPAGDGWNNLDNGAYTVTLAAGAVTDTTGNAVAAETKTFTVNIPAPDVQAPVATIDVADVSGAGGATHTLTVTYTDNRNVRESSIGTGDIRVTGPNGLLTVTGVSTQPDSNSGTIVATYTVAAPGGAWDPSDNGTYNVEVINDEVVDTAGNGVVGATKAFVVNAGIPDTTAPTAGVAANDITVAGGSNHAVVVTYTDDAALDPNSIGSDDITVSGPIGTLSVSTVVINSSNNGRTMVATYTVAAPSGGWNYRHNGTYTVTVNADAVRDLTGKGIAAATGTFRVAAPAPAPVDTTWGGGSGNVNTTFVGEAVTTTDDGYILVAGREGSVAAGNAKAVLQRLDGSGNIDSTFGQNGRVVTSGANEAFFAIVTQGNKILVAGTSDGNFLLARYNADGSLDTTFASGGRSITEMGAADDAVYGMALAPDGKIVLTGGTGGNFAFARFTADGAPDLTFDQGGKTMFDLGTTSDVPGAVAVQGDGKIIAVGSSGSNVAVVRLLANGLPDPTFSGDGLVMVNGLKAAQIASFTDRSQALALQADGKILLANHTAAGDNAVARLDGGGNLDGSFGNAGIATVDFAGDDDADAIILQTTGEIMIVGTSLQNGVARATIAALSQSGQLIEGFGLGGKLVLDALPGGAERELHVGDLVVRAFGTKQADGRIVVGTSNQAPGGTTSALKRLIVPGTTAAPSGNQIDSFGMVNGRNKKLTIDAGGGKLITFTMKGGNATVFQDGDALSLVINDDGRGAAVTIKVKGGDGRVKLSDVSTSGSIRSFNAKTADLTGTLAAGVQIGKVTLGDVGGGAITAGGSIQSLAAANLRDARVLAGTGLGSDRQLGGAAADADSYLGGAIGKITVKGEIKNSLIGAGLNPTDGTYGDDDDTVVGGPQLSYIKSISAKLGADDSTKFVAAAFKKVKLGKGKIDLATDARFKTIV